MRSRSWSCRQQPPSWRSRRFRPMAGHTRRCGTVWNCHWLARGVAPLALHWRVLNSTALVLFGFHEKACNWHRCPRGPHASRLGYIVVLARRPQLHAKAFLYLNSLAPHLSTWLPLLP